jgi:molybdopterin-guanine dinucleotide biosynthesis protein A
MFDVEGFILVGGKSTRMGEDKAALCFEGQTSIQRTAARMAPVTSRVCLVGARQDQGRSPFENVPDIHPQWGALGGIHAALISCRSQWALVVACDLPFLTTELFGRLESLRADQFDAIVPVQPDQRPQPLCAIYRRPTCLPHVERLIHRDEHTPRALLAAVNTRWVEFGELEDLPGADQFFFNMNTPADLAQARKIIQGMNLGEEPR